MTTPAPIFLLAPPRSFTTVISGMLGQHPETYGLPELNIFLHQKLSDIWQAGRGGNAFDSRLRHGLLRAIAQVYFGDQNDEAIEGAERWCFARQDRLCKDIINELRAKIAPFHIVEKSPGYTFRIEHMRTIYESCPDAKFLFLTRHPIKQCESTMALSDGTFPKVANSIVYENGKAILEPQVAWHDLNLNILEFLETYVPQDQQLRVRGEEILANPVDELQKICRWAGIRDDAEAIDAMMHPETSPFACFGPISSLFGNDPNFLRNPSFRPHVPKVPPLDAKLSWRDDGQGLYPQVIELAKEFGY